MLDSSILAVNAGIPTINIVSRAGSLSGLRDISVFPLPLTAGRWPSLRPPFSRCSHFIRTASYPHGFVNPPLYSGRRPEPRLEPPMLTERAPTVIIPNVGFMEPRLLKPLANPSPYALLERIVEKGLLSV